MMTDRAAVIEIVERRKKPSDDSLSASVVVPNEVRVNGQKILIPQGAPITVHEMSSNDVVQVTLTVFAKRIFVGHEDVDDAITDEVAAATTALLDAQRGVAESHRRTIETLRLAHERLADAHRQLESATRDGDAPGGEESADG